MFALASLSAPAPVLAAAADDTPTFSIEFHDGKITPLRLEVPANKRFRIELHNTGVTAAEFESSELHLEKVLAPNNPSPAPVLVIRSLDPGQYIFFDDLHPDAPKILLVAK
ncbi:MAG: cupredoxin domain-containing protein [Methylovirgula sp.]